MGEWEEDDFSFLFFTTDANDTVKALLADRPQIELRDQYQMSYAQWLGETFKPFRVGPFQIIPWETDEAARRDVVHRTKPPNGVHSIFLDPGVVFGTGAHPTTHDCLEALALVSDEGGIETILDLGTGAGILALAGASTGNRRVIAVDFNFLAAQTAARNVALNRLRDQVLVVRGRAEDLVNYRADLIIANIHYDVMQHLIRAPGFYRSKMFILSGLMRTEAKSVESYLAPKPVQIIKKWNNDGIWHTYLGSINQSKISEAGRSTCV